MLRVQLYASRQEEAESVDQSCSIHSSSSSAGPRIARLQAIPHYQELLTFVFGHAARSLAYAVGTFATAETLGLILLVTKK